MKTGIVTAVSSSYVGYLKTLLKSLKKHNGEKYPVHVLCHTDTRYMKCVYPYDLNEIKNTYQGIKIIEIDPGLYECFGVNNVKFFSLEAFDFSGFDRIIFLDSDVLNVSTLEPLENLPDGLHIAREDRRPDTYNKGVMVIGKKFLDRNLTEKLRAHTGRVGYGTDQALIASYFQGQMTELPRKYNALVTEDSPGDVVNWHYVVKHDCHNFRDRCGEKLYNLYREYEDLP